MAVQHAHGREQQLPPGSLSLPPVPSVLVAVVASGAVICVHDARLGRGGMAHYCRPYREKNAPSTARYAMPAIVGLVRMLEKEGARLKDIAVHLIGGAANRADRSFEKGLAEENIKVGLEILGKLGPGSVSMDTGGHTARRVAFDTASGRIELSRVDEVGPGMWYPCPASN